MPNFPYLSSRIHSAEDLSYYSKIYQSLSKSEMTMSFLENCRVYGVRLRRSGKLIGGFVINNQLHSNRHVALLPEHIREKFIAECGDDLFELTGLWIDPSAKSSVLSAYFWLKILDAVRREPKKFMIGGATEAGLKRKYGVLRPRKLSEGYVDCHGDHGVWTCFVTGKTKALLSICLVIAMALVKGATRRLRALAGFKKLPIAPKT